VLTAAAESFESDRGDMRLTGASAVAGGTRGLHLQQRYGCPDRRLPVSGHRCLRGTGTEIDFFDQDGNLTMAQVHQVEQDVFTANGKTLVGLPYTFNLRALFDPETGDVTHVFASGIASRVPLPGGNFFLTAGRVDFAAHPGADFLLQPDVGAQGNIAGFCAALAP
jgi:hypothetical protein